MGRPFSHRRLIPCFASLALAGILSACIAADSRPPATAAAASPTPTLSPPATAASLAQNPPPSATPAGGANWAARGNLMRSSEKFEGTKTGRVAFLGGSVTNGEWREGVMDYLKRRFPGTAFDFVNAGMAGTPAELAAFRLEEDVFGRGPVDLLFLEFAVNGGSAEAMEGIVRHARSLNPDIDIVQMHIAARWFSEELEKGTIPGAVELHERVAKHYGNPSIHLYREIYDRMKAGAFDWDDFAPDGVHPTAFGCSVYAEVITGFLETMWSRGGAAVRPVMPVPMTKHPWEHGALVDYRTAPSVQGFQEVKDWMPELNGNLKGPVSFLASSAPGSTVSFRFQGTIVGAYLPVGPDSAKIQYRIDGLEWTEFDTARDSWYPNDYVRLSGFVLNSALDYSEHEITFRTIDDGGRVFRLYRLMTG